MFVLTKGGIGILKVLVSLSTVKFLVSVGTIITLVSLCIVVLLVSCKTGNFLVSLSTVAVLNGSATGVALPITTTTLPRSILVLPTTINSLLLLTVVVAGIVTLPIKFTAPFVSTSTSPVKLTLPVRVVIPFVVTAPVIFTVAFVLCKKPPSATTLACPVILPEASKRIPPVTLFVSKLFKLILPARLVAPVVPTLLVNSKLALPNWLGAPLAVTFALFLKIIPLCSQVWSVNHQLSQSCLYLLVSSQL